jgi:hypothetical protein
MKLFRFSLLLLGVCRWFLSSPMAEKRRLTDRLRPPPQRSLADSTNLCSMARNPVWKSEREVAPFGQRLRR